MELHINKRKSFDYIDYIEIGSGSQDSIILKNANEEKLND